MALIQRLSISSALRFCSIFNIFHSFSCKVYNVSSFSTLYFSGFSNMDQSQVNSCFVILFSHMRRMMRDCQSIKTNLRGSITIWLTSCLLGFDSATLLLLNLQQLYLFVQIKTSQTEGRPYSYTSTLCECSLVRVESN